MRMKLSTLCVVVLASMSSVVQADNFGSPSAEQVTWKPATFCHLPNSNTPAVLIELARLSDNSIHYRVSVPNAGTFEVSRSPNLDTHDVYSANGFRLDISWEDFDKVSEEPAALDFRTVNTNVICRYLRSL